ncbi:MAG: phosphoribosylformylglycinamidine synthase, partial [Clostridia bacterium]|nr:phosphoribosylformylglycinamidine synthase [Clostridia bacterium]
MVYRIFVEKKPGLANEASALLNDIRTLLQIESVSGLRLFNRYDVENIDSELFDYAVKTVFSEPQLDIVTEQLPKEENATVFAVEYLPGQFDQRADSAAQCIQIISQKERPLVRTARVYVLLGTPSEAELNTIKKYVINPVESREASLLPVETLATRFDIPQSVATLDGFRA